MFETLRNAFRVKDIRDRIIFTFLMLIVIRIGSQLPIPGVNGELFAEWFTLLPLTVRMRRFPSRGDRK